MRTQGIIRRCYEEARGRTRPAVYRSKSVQQIQRDLGLRIRAARTSAGLTQEAAASRAGIDYKRYQRLETGRVNATIRTLHRVAVALDTDFWSLLGGPKGR
jgi:DNA-binding XRE family transcriptional regulator